MDDPNEPVELYRARGADEAHALRAHLEAAGVKARVDGELLGGLVGEAPFGWVTVPRGRLDVAEAVLADFLGGAARPTGAGAEGDAACLACGADMADEPACRACGWSYYGEYSEPAE
jgi:hypothetical protein